MCEKTVEWGKRSEPKSKTPEQALASLVRYASRAERSSGDAERLMRRWNVPAADRSAILERLKQMKFIDDRRFAAAYVRDKSEFAGWGARKIRTGLIAKGVPRDIIDEAVGVLRESGNENSRLDELILRKLRSLKSGTTYELKGKLLRFGLSRGYDYDAVTEAIDWAMSRSGSGDD